MRVAITGGAGFIGGHAARTLSEAGHTVLVLDDLSTGRAENLPPGVALRRLDVRDTAALAETLTVFHPEAVLHLAAIASVERSIADPLGTFAVNLGGTASTLEAARLSGARRFVFASSAAVYGPRPPLPCVETAPLAPASPYAAHKAAGELLARAYRASWGLETVALRFFNVYGPGQRPNDPYAGVIVRFIAALAGREQATIAGDGSQTRDFVAVEDAARAIVAALAGPDPGAEPINVGSGEALSIRTLHTLLSALLGAPDEPCFVPPRPGDVLHSRADIDRMRTVLGIEPRTTIAAGLERLIAWWREAASRATSIATPAD